MGLGATEWVKKHDGRLDGCSAIWRCRPQSLANRLKEPAVVLADVPCLFKGASPFLIEAPKVALDVTDVEIEIASDDVRVLLGRLRVIRHEGSWRRITGFRGRDSSTGSEQKYSQSNASAAQPERVNPPQNLIEARTHR